MSSVTLRTMFVPIVLTVVLATHTFAQPPVAPAAHVREMARLSFLVGRWEGRGSVEMVPGQRFQFASVEDVALHVDGLVLTIEGVHFARLPGDQAGPKVHHAFATVRYDSVRGNYSMTATRLDGATVDARGRMEGDAFIWGFVDPRAGHLRYTIRLSADGTWTEIGERSSDGVSWTRYFEMTLAKV